MSRWLSRAARRRSPWLIGGGFVAVAGAASAWLVSRSGADTPVASLVVMIGLLTLCLLLVLLLVLLLARHLVKLWLDRRRGILGARLKTRLVLAFLALAIVPAVLLFVIGTNFITRSVDFWLRTQLERPLERAVEVAREHTQHLEATVLRQARLVARDLGGERPRQGDRRSPAPGQMLAEHRRQLGADGLVVFDATGTVRGRSTSGALAPPQAAAVHERRLRQALAGQEVAGSREVGERRLVEALVPLHGRQGRVDGAVAVMILVPARIDAHLRDIAASYGEYQQLRRLQAPLKVTYIFFFLFLTLVIVFGVTWLGLKLARGVTEPIEQLVAGTREVAEGNLKYRVAPIRGRDLELGALVDAFNGMAEALDESKGRLEEAYLDLQDKHAEIEERRRWVETVVEAVATGVISVDAAGRLTTLNRAAGAMLGLEAAAGLGQPVTEVLGAPALQPLGALVTRVAAGAPAGPVTQELALRRGDTTVSLLAAATALRGPEGEVAGVVVVLEDLTDVLRAQRLAAWREIAQRIAHEIKNPLTPIQLSAERLRRRLGRLTSEQAGLVGECTETIRREVDGLRRLVNEFAEFARMPAPRLQAVDLRPLVDGVAALYRASHPAVTLTTRYDVDDTVVEADPDHLRRAVLNLVDNAVDAAGPAGEVAVEVEPAALPGRVRIAVSDSGPGVGPDTRARLFEPYYSTKTNGMGLGLPIVQQIVTEHGGSVSLDPGPARGSRFVVELPVTQPVALEARP